MQKYTCTKCGRDVGRGNLKAKRVLFREMGLNGRTERSRTTDWLCIIPQNDGSPSCLDRDPAWNQAALSGSPGMKGTKMDPDRGEVDFMHLKSNPPVLSEQDETKIAELLDAQP